MYESSSDLVGRLILDGVPLMGEYPRHVAIIMDGNGRWAARRGKPRTEGHRAGMKTVRAVIEASLESGVSVLTLYAFSSENWKRPPQEIELLMKLLGFFVDQEIDALKKNGVRVRTIGCIEALPRTTCDKVKQAVERTKDNAKLTLNIALNYGSRQEILCAAKSLARDVRDGRVTARQLEVLTEAQFGQYLETRDLPDPDLLIRTSGEMRLSNFLLWQLSYAEIYIFKKFWPDFTKRDFISALKVYSKRERRFGDSKACHGCSAEDHR